MMELLTTYLDLFIACLALLLAGLLYGIFRFHGRDGFRRESLLFIVSVTVFGLTKAALVFIPFFECTAPYCIDISSIAIAILGLFHLYFNKKSTHIIIGAYVLGTLAPLITIIYGNHWASLFAWSTIGGAWLLSEKRTRHQAKDWKKTLALTAIGSALLILMGAEMVLNAWIVPSLELFISLFGCWYVVNQLYNNVEKEFYIFITLMIMITITYFFFVNKMVINFKKNYIKNARNDLIVLKERLEEYETRCLKELKLLSWHPTIKDILKKKSSGWAELSLLEMELDASLIYILDHQGDVLASSSDVILGKNLKDRPYFKKAIKGHTNIYISKDSVTNSVGAFFARPILDGTGGIRYVLVMKMPITDIMVSKIETQKIMLTNSKGEVMVGPNEYVDRFLFDTPPQEGLWFQKNATTKRTGNSTDSGPLSLGFKMISNNLVKDRSGERYLFITVPIQPIGWFLARLIPYHLIFIETWKYAVAYFIILGSILIIGLRWFHAREWAYFLEKERDRRKKAEGVEYLLTSIIEQGSEGVMITDGEGVIEYVNKAFSEITGYPRSEIIGKHPNILKSEHHDSQFYRTIWDQIRRGYTWHGRMTNRRKDGGFYEADVIIFPLLDEKERIKYICIQRDITNEVLLERQLIQAQKMEAVGTLAGGVAHDFNNLLTGLQGYAEIGLMKLEKDHPIRYNLEQILSVCKKASGIVKQLLIFSRQESSERVYIDLNQSIEDLYKLLNRLIGENINITLALEPNLPGIMADPVNIEQILVNLVINAKDAIEQGGEIVIETRLVELHQTDVQHIQDVRPGKYVKLSIEDNGCGIPREIIPRIFDPFFTTKGPGKGTGLGLSVVYSIVKQHGGWIEVHSEPAHGTRFNIYLPVATVKYDQVQPLDQQEKPFLDGSGKVLVFIEDDAQIRDVVEQYLERANFKVLTAATLEEGKAIVKAQGEVISLIVSDIILPDGNAFHFIRDLNISCPVIFTTGYIDQIGIKTEILQAGYGFLAKPYSESELLKAIKKALDR